MKLNTVEPSSMEARQSCKPGRAVLSSPGRVSGLENSSAMQEGADVAHAHDLQAPAYGAEIFRHRVEAGEGTPPRRTSKRCR